MQEPPIRHSTAASIDYIARRLALAHDRNTQDWAFEVAEPADLDRYLALYAEVAGEDDVRFTVADMILQAFEDSEISLDEDPRWYAFTTNLAENFDLHAHQIWYWSSWDCSLEDSWKVAPYMRTIRA